MARGQDTSNHPNRQVHRSGVYSDKVIDQEKLLMDYANAHPDKNPFTKYIIANDGAANALTEHYRRRETGVDMGTDEHVPHIEPTLQQAIKWKGQGK